MKLNSESTGAASPGDPGAFENPASWRQTGFVNWLIAVCDVPSLIGIVQKRRESFQNLQNKSASQSATISAVP
jgi:hypothetical protein